MSAGSSWTCYEASLALNGICGILMNLMIFIDF